MTAELYEQKALQALRVLRGCTHPPTMDVLKKLAEDYAAMAAMLRHAERHTIGGQSERLVLASAAAPAPRLVP